MSTSLNDSYLGPRTSLQTSIVGVIPKKAALTNGFTEKILTPVKHQEASSVQLQGSLDLGLCAAHM